MKNACVIGSSFLLFVAVTILFSCKDASTPEELPWFQTHAIPFLSADPSTPEPNLAALQEIIGHARIVGLGEATHGTSEFWGIRQKITEYLVKEMGFTAILIEAGFPNSIYLHDYVTRGEGSAEVAHQKLEAWHYQEMRTLIDWMRQFNIENTGQGSLVHFFGYDCAFRSWDVAIELITDYLQIVDTANVNWLTMILKNYTAQNAELVCDHFIANADVYIENSSTTAYRLHLRIVQNLAPSWTVWYNLKHNLPDLSIRDEFNHGNVNWIITNVLDGGKAVIWAHNGHVGNTYLQENQGVLAQMLGSRLKEQLGEDYYVIATEFYGGQFMAWDRCGGHEYEFVAQQAALPPETSYAYRFHAEDIPLFLLDLRQIDYSLKETAWLSGPLNLRYIGASYCADRDWPLYYRSISIAEEYDGIIYIEETSPVTPVSFTW